MKKCIFPISWIGICLLFLMLFCGCQEKPAYMTPYGDGTEVRPATADSINTLPTSVKTTASVSKTTTTTIPENHKLCPECRGEKLICDPCEGTGKVLSSIEEVLDPDSDRYVFKGDPCPYCELDPGYEYCYNCENLGYIPIASVTKTPDQ